MLALYYFISFLNTFQQNIIELIYLHHFHAGLLIAEDDGPYNPGFPPKPITFDAAPLIWGDC